MTERILQIIPVCTDARCQLIKLRNAASDEETARRLVKFGETLTGRVLPVVVEVGRVAEEMAAAVVQCQLQLQMGRGQVEHLLERLPPWQLQQLLFSDYSEWKIVACVSCPTCRHLGPFLRVTPAAETND